MAADVAEQVSLDHCKADKHVEALVLPQRYVLDIAVLGGKHPAALKDPKPRSTQAKSSGRAKRPLCGANLLQQSVEPSTPITCQISDMSQDQGHAHDLTS